MTQIPEEELYIEFARSGGPGGQKVNKTESKVTVRWNINASTAFSAIQKTRVHRLLGNRINKDGELAVTAEEERSQHQNRERAIARLQELVAAAIIPPKVRRKTKPSRAQKEKRLQEKKQQSEKKALRKRIV
ncbi:aminoacyl-tRNA hydrolase [Patescibacteria group bacterium]|nr:aminoacyl-tRNA hydrolase [Patescibacteria group bacterium]